MTDPNYMLDGWKLAQILMGILLGLLGWMGVRLHSRVDTSVSKDDFRDALVQLREERDSLHQESREERLRLHKENTENFRDLARKLDMQLVHEQRIAQCERDINSVTKYAEELKHVYVDPYLIESAKLKQRVDMMESRRT